MITPEMSASLRELIGILYETASNPESWRCFLDAATHYFGAQGANLLHLDSAHPALSASLLTGFDPVSADVQQRYRQQQVPLPGEDPRIAYSLKFPNMPFRCADVMPVEKFHATRVYREFLQPSGIEHSLMVQYSDVPEVFAGLALLRGPAQAQFNDADVAALGALVPHLRRATAMRQRLDLLERQAQGGLQVLDALPIGIVIVHPCGRVEFANAAANTIFALNDGIGVVGDRLAGRRRRDADGISVALRRVGCDGGHQAMRLERPSGGTDFQLLITRLGEPEGMLATHRFQSQPRLTVILCNPDDRIETNPQVLQRLFGLTATEGRVLARITAGRSPDEVAADLGVGIVTVRSHLSALFAKTGANRQSELVRKVLRSPAGLS